MTSWWISDRAELKLQMEQLGRLLQAKNEWLSHYSLSQGWPWIQKWGEIFSRGRDLANVPDNLPCTERDAAQSKKIYRLMKVKLLSHVRLFVTLWTVAYQAPLSMGFSVHGILQARILEWVTISFSRGSSRPRDRTWVSHIGGRRFNLWTTREAHHTYI